MKIEANLYTPLLPKYNPMIKLNDDILTKIFLYVRGIEIFSFNQVCRRFYKLPQKYTQKICQKNNKIVKAFLDNIKPQHSISVTITSKDDCLTKILKSLFIAKENKLTFSQTLMKAVHNIFFLAELFCNEKADSHINYVLDFDGDIKSDIRVDNCSVSEEIMRVFKKIELSIYFSDQEIREILEIIRKLAENGKLRSAYKILNFGNFSSVNNLDKLFLKEHLQLLSKQYGFTYRDTELKTSKERCEFIICGLVFGLTIVGVISEVFARRESFSSFNNADIVAIVSFASVIILSCFSKNIRSRCNAICYTLRT